MAAAPTQGSTYDKITIHSNDGKSNVDLRLGVAGLQYYEDLFSPTITAKMMIVNTGQSINNRGIYNGLPIRGGEKVEIELTTPIEEERKDKGEFKVILYVNKISDYVQEKQKEVFTLHLISKEGITNLNKRVIKKYKAKRIDEVIKDFLKMVDCEYEDEDIEKTENAYNFIGNMRKPFTLAPMLASRAIPEGGKSTSAGFVFWQTRKGMKFKSIETLCKKKKEKENLKASFVFNRVNEPLVDPEKSFTKVLSYGVVNNNNITASQKQGEYSTYRIYFNPSDLTFTQPNESVFRPEGKTEQEKMGSEETPIPELVDPGKIPKPEMAHRIITGVYSCGTLEEKVSGNDDKAKINMDEKEDVSQAISRYSSIFTQVITLTVPCNIFLCAGDIIKCDFPQVSSENEVDDAQSGLYIIKEISHFFVPNKSYTAMKVIRDTSGV